jgi:hypothetical protein
VRCWRFGAAARREEGEYPLWIFDQRATPLQRQRFATLRAKFWQAAGCVAPQSQSASAMLLRRALPAARQNLAHSFPIYEMGSKPDHVHFFCRPEPGATKLSEFIGAWKSWTSRKIHALGGPGQRPQLQRCGNANSSITFFAPMRVTARNGITFSIIRFARDWFRRRKNGNTPERLKR